jgi:Integrase zinc binding domain
VPPYRTPIAGEWSPRRTKEASNPDETVGEDREDLLQHPLPHLKVALQRLISGPRQPNHEVEHPENVLYHDHKTVGHPGITRTLALIAKDYWWPDMTAFVKVYIQGCAVCQSTKSGTMRPKVPLVPILPKQTHIPFDTIALDLITDLPESEGYNSILTITNHDCSKAAIFIPYHKSVDSEGITQCYAQHIFPHYRPPKRVILDQDPQITSKWTRELCWILSIDQNISTAYHPQTNGQSERTNQWPKQYLQIYGNFQQNDWVTWLPMVQFVHNLWQSKTTKQTPFKLLIGYILTIGPIKNRGKIPDVDWCKEHLSKKCNQAKVAIQKAQAFL